MPDFLSLYCERSGHSLFAEPLNVLSNAAFFIAAWLLWRQYIKTHKKFDEERIALIALIALIGLGSTLFHLAPSQFTLYGDVLPISLFVVFSLYTCLRRLLGCSLKQALLLLIAFSVADVLTNYVPQPYRFNESIGYFPCLAALALIAIVLYRRHHPAAGNFFKLTGLFALSLIFRSIDIAACPDFHFGTHFLWHICNGVIVYWLAETIQERRAAER